MTRPGRFLSRLFPTWVVLSLILSPVVAWIAFRLFAGVFGGGYYSVPTRAMMPTLQVGEGFLALPISTTAPPARGEVVLFRHPQTPETEWVKRVVALPGERWQMKDGALHIDGEPVVMEQIEDWDLGLVGDLPPAPRSRCRIEDQADGPHCLIDQWAETLPGGRAHQLLDLGDVPVDDTPEITVPEGHIAVLGDNRDNSIDSRFRQLGMVPLDNLTGRAWIYFVGISDQGIRAGRIFKRIQ